MKKIKKMEKRWQPSGDARYWFWFWFVDFIPYFEKQQDLVSKSRKSKSLSAKKRRCFHQDPSHVSASRSVSREREREEIFESNCTLAPPGFRGESSNKSDSLTGDCTDKVRLCLNWYFPWLCKFLSATRQVWNVDQMVVYPCLAPNQEVWIVLLLFGCLAQIVPPATAYVGRWSTSCWNERQFLSCVKCQRSGSLATNWAELVVSTNFSSGRGESTLEHERPLLAVLKRGAGESKICSAGGEESLITRWSPLALFW